MRSALRRRYAALCGLHTQRCPSRRQHRFDNAKQQRTTLAQRRSSSTRLKTPLQLRRWGHVPGKKGQVRPEGVVVVAAGVFRDPNIRYLTTVRPLLSRPLQPVGGRQDSWRLAVPAAAAWQRRAYGSLDTAPSSGAPGQPRLAFEDTGWGGPGWMCTSKFFTLYACEQRMHHGARLVEQLGHAVGSTSDAPLGRGGGRGRGVAGPHGQTC
eukprot:364201-Chlamydomonas_euryale.AAC.9